MDILPTPAKAESESQKYGINHLLWAIARIARRLNGGTCIGIGSLANVMDLQAREVETLLSVHLRQYVGIEARADLYQIRAACGWKFHSVKGIAEYK